MSVLLMPLGNDAPFIDENGNPLSGGLLYFYVGGSVGTLQDTYTTSAGNVANANPVVLGTGGYPTVSNAVVEIWGTAGQTYKAVLKTSAGVTVWTRDNLQLINDTTVSISEWISGPTPTYVGATSFTLVGDQTSTFNVGRRLKTTNSGGTIYSTITASAYGALTTVTVRNDSGTLDAGLSAVSYGLLSSTNESIPVYQEAKRAVVGVSTAWDPSDVVGTLTAYGGSTIVSSITATDYITMALASGVWTFTSVRAGVYRFTLNMYNESLASAAPAALTGTVGGTAAAQLGVPTRIVCYAGNCDAASSTGFGGSGVFYASMTAGQTIIITPKVGITSAGATTSFTTQATVSAEYCGST